MAPPSNTVGEHAALPSTDAILAGMLVQTALKHLLEFQEAPAQGSLSVPEDKLASKVAKPHESCAELQCRKLQQKFVRKPSRCRVLSRHVTSLGLEWMLSPQRFNRRAGSEHRSAFDFAEARSSRICAGLGPWRQGCREMRRSSKMAPRRPMLLSASSHTR